MHDIAAFLIKNKLKTKLFFYKISVQALQIPHRCHKDILHWWPLLHPVETDLWNEKGWIGACTGTGAEQAYDSKVITSIPRRFFLTFSVLGQVGLNNQVKVGVLEDLKWEGSPDGYLNYFLAIVQTVI